MRLLRIHVGSWGCLLYLRLGAKSPGVVGIFARGELAAQGEAWDGARGVCWPEGGGPKGKEC